MENNHNLYDAHTQWANRPADERYWSVRELATAMQAEQHISREWQGTLNACKFGIAESSGALMVKTPNGSGAIPSHWAMSQLCGRLNTPQGYLSSLPGELAARCLNHALGQAGDNTDTTADAKFLVRVPADGSTRTLRAVTSERYGRLWNSEVLRMAEELTTRGWKVPPARPAGKAGERTRQATADDVIHAGKHGLSVKIGDDIAPAGVYAGDRDMFVFLVNEDRAIELDGFRGFRGVFLWNSEVGAKTFGMTIFLYDSVCGNHIVWGGKVFADVKTRHTRYVSDRWHVARSIVNRSIELPAATEVRMIEAARTIKLGDAKDAVIDAVYEVVRPTVTRADVDASYQLAEQFTDSHHVSPMTAWGMAAGLTRYSQTAQYQDRRDSIDRAAGMLLARVTGGVNAGRLIA